MPDRDYGVFGFVLRRTWPRHLSCVDRTVVVSRRLLPPAFPRRRSRDAYGDPRGGRRTRDLGGGAAGSGAAAVDGRPRRQGAAQRRELPLLPRPGRPYRQLAHHRWRVGRVRLPSEPADHHGSSPRAGSARLPGLPALRRRPRHHAPGGGLQPARAEAGDGLGGPGASADAGLAGGEAAARRAWWQGGHLARGGAGCFEAGAWAELQALCRRRWSLGATSGGLCRRGECHSDSRCDADGSAQARGEGLPSLRWLHRDDCCTSGIGVRERARRPGGARHGFGDGRGEVLPATAAGLRHVAGYQSSGAHPRRPGAT
mmetsp:Transcript_80792/g.261964  ORF Transcript_80792/g.261964 Transcript_80792/m.261964 type:complete len:314 (+) Transcript_80792:1462-2403(+)